MYELVMSKLACDRVMRKLACDREFKSVAGLSVL